MIPSTALPLQIPGYRIERLLGRGGMASVYLATQESLDRLVALKILHTDKTPPGFAERFISEGKIIAALNHPYIITIHDIGVVDNIYYISMEYVAGGDLRQLIQQGMTPQQSLDIVRKIGHCLQFVHQKGIVHRDIKPANILFGDDVTPLLTDFGIAKKTQSELELTATGTTLGSPHYLSPEQAQCLPVDGRADLYSLGIMLYEMLVGVKPYDGDSEIGIIFKHLQEPIPQLPSYLQAYQPFLNKLLAKNRDDRFANAGEMLMALKALAQQQEFPTLPTLSISKTPVIPPPAALDPSVPANAKKSTLPWLAGVGIMGLLAITGILLLEPWQPRRNTLAPAGWVAPAENAPNEPAPSAIETPTETPTETPIETPAPKESTVTVTEPAPEQPIAALTPPPAPASTPAPPPDTVPVEAPTEIIEEPTPVNPAPPENSVAVEPEADLTEILPAEETLATAASVAVTAPMIADWLKQAQARMAADKLTTPPQDSALYYYRKILAQEANHAEALAGINTIADRYADLARNRIAQADYAKARIHIKRGLAVKADHAELLQLQKQLRTQMTAQSQPKPAHRPPPKKDEIDLLEHPKRWIRSVKSLFQ